MSTGQSGSATGYLTALFRGGTLSSKSDSELLEQFIAARSERDESAQLAFSALLSRHGAMVLRVCRGVLRDDHQAEDAFQATFLILASRAKSIRRQVSVASWLYGVALRVATTERSRTARRRRHEQRRAMMTTESTPTALADDEAARVLHQEIGLLPERYRSAVVLCYLEGLTHEQAAERLEPPGGHGSQSAGYCARSAQGAIDPSRVRTGGGFRAGHAGRGLDDRAGRARRGDRARGSRDSAQKDGNRGSRFRGNDCFDGRDAAHHYDHSICASACVVCRHRIYCLWCRCNGLLGVAA